VDRDQGSRDPWWGKLYEFLVNMPAVDLEWQYEQVQDKYFVRIPLVDDQRRDIVRYLRTAPAGQVEGHRTLRRAVALTAEQETKLEMMYFSKDPLGARGQSN
jgi:hypothetical protein